MPTYRTVKNGVQLSQALAEAAAVAPVGRAMLVALELRHPALLNPVRIVHNHEAIFATLEAGAPVGAGTTVEFMATFMEVTEPEESDTAATPEITVTLDNVGGLASEALKLARDSLVPWELTERLYASDDLSGPAMLPPLTLECTSARIAGNQLVLTASFGDHTNVAIPRLTFKAEEYIGLTAR